MLYVSLGVSFFVAAVQWKLQVSFPFHKVFELGSRQTQTHTRAHRKENMKSDIVTSANQDAANTAKQTQPQFTSEFEQLRHKKRDIRRTVDWFKTVLSAGTLGTLTLRKKWNERNITCSLAVLIGPAPFFFNKHSVHISIS